jgi:hypothetical protein
MLDENIINDLIKLVRVGIITVAEIKDPDYRAEVENRINAA